MITSQEICEVYSQLGVPKGAKLAIAVSGGADSLALLHLSAQAYDVAALTVDHGLRVEAADEALYVAALCENLGVRHVTLHWDGDKPGANIQAEAREARYALLENWCIENGYAYLAAAHHRNDQAETFLLRLARGSGVYGLASMGKCRVLKRGIKLIRPLLTYLKQDLVSYLDAQNIHWVEDPSNEAEKYDRVKIRQFLEKPPLDGFSVDRIAETATRMASARDALAFYEHGWLKAYVREEFGYAVLDQAGLEAVPEEIILRGLSALCRAISGKPYAPRFEKLQRLKAALSEPSFKGTTLSRVKFSFSSADEIYICREYNAVEGYKPLTETGEWDNRFSFDAKGDIAGLKIGSLGEKGLKFLKEYGADDALKGVPRMALLTWPAIYSGEDLRLVPHLGYSDLTGVEINFASSQRILT